MPTKGGPHTRKETRQCRCAARPDTLDNTSQRRKLRNNPNEFGIQKRTRVRITKILWGERVEKYILSLFGRMNKKQNAQRKPNVFPNPHWNIDCSQEHDVNVRGPIRRNSASTRLQHSRNSKFIFATASQHLSKPNAAPPQLQSKTHRELG